MTFPFPLLHVESSQMCSCEIRPNAIRVRSTVVVRITIVVDIGKIGRIFKSHPKESYLFQVFQEPVVRLP